MNDIYQLLDPVAFTIGPFSVRWYGLAYIAAFVVAYFVICHIAKRWKTGITSDDVFFLVISVAFGVIIGGRLGYCIFYGNGYYFINPIKILALNEGGMSFHGGLVGAICAGALVSWRLRVPFLTLADMCAIVTPIGLFFGRIANFINGELWGKVTTLPWGVVFETGGSLPRHPSQLYEAFLEGLVIFIVLFALSRKVPPRPRGTFLGVFLVLYGIFRFLIEFVRVPDGQLGYIIGNSITMGQLLSLPMIAAGALLLLWSCKKRLPQQSEAANGDE